MENRVSLYFVIFLLLLMALIIGVALRFPDTESKIIPLFAASVVFILAAVQLVREIRTKGKVAEPKEMPDSEVENKNEIWRRSCVLFGWIIGFFIIIYLFGFLVAVPIFVFSYLKLSGYRWLISIISALILTALIHGVFNIALKAELFKGIILEGL
jgi:hypothetical protein